MLCGIWSTPLLPSLPGPLWPEMVAPDRVLFMSQIELDCILMANWIVWKELFLHLAVCKQKTILIVNWIVWNRTVFDI